MLWRLLDGWLSPPPNRRRVEWLGQWTYAHRGLHGPGRTENSTSAFAAALSAGLGIECDIQRSLDDWPMVFHDWDFTRLLGREDAGESLTKDEWQALRYPGLDEGPLTVSDLLDLVAGAVPLLIEIKSRQGYDVERTCSQVVASLEGYSGLHAVMSFDPRVSCWLRRHSPKTVRGLVVTEHNERSIFASTGRRASLWHACPDFLAYDIRDLPSPFAEAQRRRGLPLLSWTVSTAQLAERARLYADAPIAEGEGLAPAPGNA